MGHEPVLYYRTPEPLDAAPDQRTYRHAECQSQIVHITILVLFCFGGLVLGAISGTGRIGVLVGVILAVGLGALILWPIGRMLRVDFQRCR